LEDQRRRDLLEMAFRRVRRQVAPSTWDAFAATTLEARSSAEVASGMGVPVHRVYDLKRRVLRMLRKEVRRLQG
jgi:DNA-directed RNA polymerase specialized sigma24 family protein